MKRVTCICGTEFHSPRGRQYCSEKCRKRIWRAKQDKPSNVRRLPLPDRAEPKRKRVTPLDAPGKLPTVDEGAPEACEPESVTARVTAELAAANALETANGALALKLAAMIDQADVFGGGGSHVAGWSREMRAALATATADAPVAAEDDPIERRAKRRAERAAG